MPLHAVPACVMPEHLVIAYAPPPPRLRRPRGCESWCFFRTPDTPPGCAPPGRCRRPLCSPSPAAPDRTPDTGPMDRCGRRPQASQDGWKYCPYSCRISLRQTVSVLLGLGPIVGYEGAQSAAQAGVLALMVGEPRDAALLV